MSDLVKIDVSRDKLTAAIRISSVECITGEEVFNALKNSGIVYGILSDVVNACTSSRPGEAMVIARGDPSVPGASGWVELLWEKQCGQDNCSPDTAKAVDFRETSKLVSVDEGTLLAQRHPPREGTPGKAVTGELIMPPPPKAARIIAGRGVKLDDSGNRAYSLFRGRPVAKSSGTAVNISVEPSYTVTGDVSLKTGNIRFKGDVTVTGNVAETMSVEASGSVNVKGIVTGARIYCGEALIVQKNIISSEISAGLGQVECGKVKHVIQELYTDLVKMLQVMEQLRGQSPNLDRIPFPQVVNGLIESRFKNIRVHSRQLAGLKNFNLPSEVEEALESVRIIAGMQFGQDDFKMMMGRLSQALVIINSQENKGARVEVGSASASVIKCSGDVVVLGKGCVNTTIYAGGNVKINGHFKGGEISCEGNAEIDELGSDLGAPPLVKVKSKQFVKINKTLPGSVVQIGSNRMNIPRELGRSVFRLNSDNEIEVVPLR
ncbi:MAG: DUF342 domain-containing protein [Bacillota bacterium]